MKPQETILWQVIYKLYPPFLRLLEKVKFHDSRQDYLIGHLKAGCCSADLEKHLLASGYENAILAWKDPGELLSYRKIHEQIFQFHIRLFADGEIRCHYEFSSEGNPWGHVRGTVFEERREYFEGVLKGYLSN